MALLLLEILVIINILPGRCHFGFLPLLRFLPPALISTLSALVIKFSIFFDILNSFIAQLAGAVEYTDCTSAGE